MRMLALPGYSKYHDEHMGEEIMQQADPPIKKRPRPRLAVGIILLVLCLGLCATSEYVNQLDRAQQAAFLTFIAYRELRK